MSRTDKDRPYWTLGYEPHRIYEEDHSCGLNRLQFVGFEVVTETRLRWVPGYFDTSFYFPRYCEGRYEGHEVTFKRRKYVRQDVKCTIDVVPTSQRQWYELPCRHTPIEHPGDPGWKFYSRNPSWWTKETVHKPDRAFARARLTEAAQLYRADPESMADWDYGPQTRYEPWYW